MSDTPNTPNDKPDTSGKIDLFDKEQANLIGVWIKNIDSCLNLAYKLALGGGVIIIFSYCAHIHYHPSSMSLSDVLLFIFAIFAFGILDVFFIIYGFISILWLSVVIARLHDRKKPRQRSPDNSSTEQSNDANPSPQKKHLIISKSTERLSVIFTVGGLKNEPDGLFNSSILHSKSM